MTYFSPFNILSKNQIPFSIKEYEDTSLFLISSFFLGLLLCFLVVAVLFNNKIDQDKSSVYECGFNPFSESRYRFDVKFYLVSLLFVIFDVEILYFFPLAFSLPYLPLSSLTLFLFFILVLILGLIYEISRSLLDFEEK